MRFTSRPFALLALLTLLALSIPLAPRHTAGAQGILAAARKLSAITATDGYVGFAQVIGDRIIYRASYDVEDRVDLYSAPLAGGAPTRLSASLNISAVEDVAVTPSGKVVFVVAVQPQGPRYIYSVPMTGGTPLLLGPTYPDPPPFSGAGGSDMGFAIFGEQVIFGADVQRRLLFELYSVAATGGTVTKLSAEPSFLPGGLYSLAGVERVEVGDNTGRVVYNSVEALFGKGTNLYTLGPTAGPPVKLNTVAGIGNATTQFAFTPDESRVLFVAYSATNPGEQRLVSILPNGTGGVILLNSWTDYETTPDSATILYTLGNELRSIPVTGGASSLVTTFTGSTATGITIDPAGAYAFVTVSNGGNQELRRVPLTGGASQLVLSSTSASVYKVTFTASGSRAVIQLNSFNSGPIYSAPTASGTATRIDNPTHSAGGTVSFQGLGAGDRVLYNATTGSSGSPSPLYSVPVTGGAATNLTSNLPANEQVARVLVAPASGDVIIAAGRWLQQGATITRMSTAVYAVDAAGGAQPRLIDRTRALVGDVEDYAVSEADGRAVYLADQTTDGVRELFSVPLAGGVPTRLNTAGQTVVSFKVSPIGGRVVYAALPAGQATASLFSVPIGGGAPTPIVASLPSGRAEIAFTPDGARVLFRATNVSSPDASTLYSAPAAGGNATTIAENVKRFFLDPTSKRVVFLNDLLRSAPVAGGSVADLGAVGNLTALDGQLLITPDGARVIYAPTNFAGLKGYVSQPIAGGATTELVAPADNPARPTVQLSADGAYLLYGAQQPITNLNDPLVYRIQRIPVAGGAAVTLRELILPAESQSLTFDFSQAPGGGPVVYHISRTGPNTTVEHTLGSVPVSGGQAVTIYGPANISRVDLPYTLSDDGEQVLFRAVNALYRVPAAGGVSPVKISGESPVTAFNFAGDAAIFIEGGDLTYAPLDGAARQLERPADDARARSFVVAGETVVFTGVRPVSTATGETVELYAVDLAEELKVFLPMISR